MSRRAPFLAALMLAAGPASAQPPEPIDLRPSVDAPTAEPFAIHHLRDLGHQGQFVDYVPEPDQGVRHVTEAGTVWWGWGPAGSEPRPLVVLFHGSNRTGESMVDLWREVAERERLVLVAPDFEGVEGWDRGLPDPRRLIDALQDAVRRHPIDPARVAFFGHSRGGIAAQLLANRLTGPWRAVAVHTGTVHPDAMQPVEAGPPIRHYLGAQDRTFPFDPALESGRAIARKGHPYDVVRLERRTHWLYDRGEEIAEIAWRWLAEALAAQR